VVTLIADKVKRQYARFTVLQTDCIRQPVRQLRDTSDIKIKPIIGCFDYCLCAGPYYQYRVFRNPCNTTLKMHKANCTGYSICGAQIEQQLNNFVLLINTTLAAKINTTTWAFNLISHYRVLTIRLIAYLTQPAVAVARFERPCDRTCSYFCVFDYPIMCVQVQTKEQQQEHDCSIVDYCLWCRSIKQLVYLLCILSNCPSEQ